MHEEIFELFACRWLWQKKLLFQMGKGLCHLVLRSNNSHTLCFQSPESTVTGFSVELLVLLPSCLVWRWFLGGCVLCVLRVPVPARLWGASCCLRRLIHVSGRGKPFRGLVRVWSRMSQSPPALLGTDSRTNNQVFLTRTAVLAAMCVHSPGYSYTSRRKRPEK